MNSTAPEVPGFEGEFITLNMTKILPSEIQQDLSKSDRILIDLPIELRIRAHDHSKGNLSASFLFVLQARRSSISGVIGLSLLENGGWLCKNHDKITKICPKLCEIATDFIDVRRSHDHFKGNRSVGFLFIVKALRSSISGVIGLSLLEKTRKSL